MAGITSLLRPSRLIRRRAVSSGLFGPSKFWRVIALALLGKQAWSKMFGNNPEKLVVHRIGSGSTMLVATSKPLTRRQRRRLKQSGQRVTLKSERVAAQRAAAELASQKLARRKQRKK